MNKMEGGSLSLSSSSSDGGPFHVLMATAAVPTFVAEPRMKRDYISKRAKAFGIVNTVSNSSNSNSSNSNSNATIDTGDDVLLTSPWDGVSRIERELVDCCEKMEEGDEPNSINITNTTTTTTSSSSANNHNNNTTTDDGANSSSSNNNDNKHPGALQIDKEVKFVGLLAHDCHSMASRCLALAILEKTLEAYLQEEEEEEEQQQQQLLLQQQQQQQQHQSSMLLANGGEVAEGNNEADTTASDDRSERARKRQKLNSGQMTTTTTTTAATTTALLSGKESFEEEEVTRLEQFLAAGGLKLLNRWLVEACNPEVATTNSSSSSSKSKSHNSKSTTTTITLKQPTTRPLIIPILRFLEKIPFDKKVVIESKINKQIRKLGKLVDGILEARARGKHRPDDLENWTTEPVSAETDALDQVKEAVEALKSSWEEKAKKKSETFSAPFEPIKKTLRERLDSLLRYEAGGGVPKPEWLEIEGQNSNNSNNNNNNNNNNKEAKEAAKKRANMKTTKTQDLAAKERKAEREGLKNRLHAAENEHRERLAKLREQLRKLKQEHAPSLAKPATNNGRKVVWKDGMRSQTNRNRDLLEEVRIYVKNTPASSGSESSSNTSDNGVIGGGGTPESTTAVTNVEEEDDDDDDDEDMFADTDENDENNKMFVDQSLL